MSRFATVGPSDAALVDAVLGAPHFARYSASVAELDEAGVALVLAFGKRAASLLVPDFRMMEIDHGRATLGASGRWMVMAVRTGDMADTVEDLSAAETLLMCDGLVELVQPAPPRGWPERVSFLVFERTLKTGRCLMCGGGEPLGKYAGDGLVWKLCERHAWVYHDWAPENPDAMAEHVEIAADARAVKKAEQAAARAKKKLINAGGPQ